MVDGVQIILNFYITGIVANRVIDAFIALSFGFFLLMNSQLDMKRFLAIGASFFAEAIPLVDTFPFWVLDGYYSMKIDVAHKKAEDEAEEADAIAIIESAKQAMTLKQIERQKVQAMQEDTGTQKFNQVAQNNTRKNDGRAVPMKKQYSETKNEMRIGQKVS